MPFFPEASALYAEETPVASAARTASGDTGILDGYAGADTIRATLVVTAASGTSPTLNVVIEDTLDGATWSPVGTFAQRTAAGQETINVTIPFARRLRVRWTIAGTAPSFTFEVRWALEAN